MKNKGIPYSDDLDCSRRLVKYHTTGYKNIFSLRIVYSFIAPTFTGKRKSKSKMKQKIIRLDYGNYSSAISRFRLESFGEKSPTKIIPERMDIVLQTYNGETLVNEELMVSRFFDEMRYAGYNPSKYNSYEWELVDRSKVQ